MKQSRIESAGVPLAPTSEIDEDFSKEPFRMAPMSSETQIALEEAKKPGTRPQREIKLTEAVRAEG